MKIICIGRNYAAHARELRNDLPTEPVFFLKPETALVQKNRPFFYPDFSKDVHHEVEIVVRINRLGKNIQEKFAHKYYKEITLGLDFTARDLQEACKQKGLPWEKAKAFDHSAPVGKWVDVSTLPHLENLKFELKKNGETVQQGSTADMIFSIDQIISYVSTFVTLKIGDILFTGTPAGVGPVSIGDQLEAFLEGEQLLKCAVR